MTGPEPVSLHFREQESVIVSEESLNLMEATVGMKSAAAIAYEVPGVPRVLIIGGSEFRQSLRASVLRAHGLHVDVARELAGGRSLWQQNTYDWVLLDVHSQLPGEVMDFCEQLRHAAPRQRIAFLVGHPVYVTLEWPREAITEDKQGLRPAAGLKAAA